MTLSSLTAKSAGYTTPGVRPSPGAASLKPVSAPCFWPPWQFRVAAPVPGLRAHSDVVAYPTVSSVNEHFAPQARLIGVISNVKSKTAAREPQLAKGQVWRLQHVYIQIVELGKRLLEYKMLDAPGQRGARIQMSSVDVMREYLETRHATLMTTGTGL